MNPDPEILYPVIALAGWTFAVLGLVPLRRFRAAFARDVVADDFKFGESVRVPPVVSIPNRNYMNLLELPVLFYVVCLMLYVTATSDPLSQRLAWAFVLLRVLHSVVHLTYNQVFHRLTLFALGNFALLALWVTFVLRLSS